MRFALSLPPLYMQKVYHSFAEALEAMQKELAQDEQDSKESMAEQIR